MSKSSPSEQNSTLSELSQKNVSSMESESAIAFSQWQSSPTCKHNALGQKRHAQLVRRLRTADERGHGADDPGLALAGTRLRAGSNVSCGRAGFQRRSRAQVSVVCWGRQGGLFAAFFRSMKASSRAPWRSVWQFVRVGALVPENSAAGYFVGLSKLEKRKQRISLGLVRSLTASIAEPPTLSAVY